MIEQLENVISWMSIHSGLVGLLLFFVVQHVLARKIKHILAQKYKYTGFEDKGDESYIMYYKKLQHMELVRFVILFCVAMYALATYQSGIFSVLAVALGAMILTFQSFLLSFGVYFYLVSQYRVGDTIRIGSLWQGEIVYLEPLHIGIASRGLDGNHTGELFVIPNNIARSNPITKTRLSLQEYTRQLIRIAYDMKLSILSFEEFVSSLESFLDTQLPKPPKQVYYKYQSYIGFTYKLHFDTGEFKDGRQVVYIDISFLVRSLDASQYKRAIIDFVDSLLYHPGKTS